MPMILQQANKFSMDEVGNPTTRAKLIETIGQAPKAGIIHVHRYEAKNGHGEIADYFYLKGVDYGRMKAKSIAQLSDLENDPDFSVVVNWKQWINPVTGKKTTGNAKCKELRTMGQTFNADNSVLKEAFVKIRKSLEAPQKARVEYEKLDNGVYAQDDGTIHIRDCQLITKTIRKIGDWPVKTTSELNAVADAVKRLLTVSKYRQVRLDGRFDYISVGGQIVMQNEGGSENFMGLPEHKNMVKARNPFVEWEIEMEVEQEQFQELISVLS